ncbi:vinorine synthase-like [Prunus avium]|uniref:Vinorine synthase-like n=1 Tax=Prunus avium TaxID=42229 RepID=A0A6P5S837_PRUAV|nr:vinorine synthase-like [Prunus avium]
MEMKIEIVSKDYCKPSIPTPHHLKSYRLSLLDQLSPIVYVPVVLFYSAPENIDDDTTIFYKLKKSLSETLTCFYPLAGRIEGNTSVDCEDVDVVFTRARANIQLSDILKSPDMNLVQQLLPLDPYNIRTDKAVAAMAVQLNFFDSGGMGIGICISHKIADGATLSSFLDAWATRSRGVVENITPSLNSATIFPPRDTQIFKPSNLIKREKIVTKRFVFDASSLARMKVKASKGLGMDDHAPTRVEAVTALICKSSMNAKNGTSGKGRPSMAISHVVNLRERMAPPLPEHSFGNIWWFAVASIMKDERNIELHDIVVQLRKVIRKINDDYAKKLQGEDGFSHACEHVKETRELVSQGEVEFYKFSSWVRFPFYNTDFGWGKPIWACISNVPVKNVVILMSSSSGDGIEAWVTLEEEDMAKLECDHELLEFCLLA